MPQIPVNLSDARYIVEISPGLTSRVGLELAKISQTRKAAILTDDQVGPLHLPALVESLRASHMEPVIATIPAGEDHKTLATLLPVFDEFLGARMERTTPILALGGGVIGDMAGFVAATILRGVPFVQIPTTLLSMVDASVGGKTGVNAPSGKNLIGAFHQPIAVFADPQVLKTLPRRELIGGLAECIKHEIIRDAEGFTALEKNIDAALALDMTVLTDLIAHNVKIKTRVVEADPFEHGERAHLNFGHTFGHAIEKASDFSYSHGESVALGMVAAANLAADLKMLEPAARDRIVALIAKAGLPISGLTLDVSKIHDAMAFDKKVKQSRIRLILPDRIGHVVIRDDVPPEFVRTAIERLR